MLDAANVLYRRHGTHLRAYLPAGQVVSTILGLATVRYLTDDGYVGVHVAGDPESRTEEVPAEQCEVVGMVAS
jgi:hypothetical protein